MPIFSISSRSSTWHSTPASLASDCARSAIMVGVSSFAGSFAMSRAWFVPWPRIRPRSAPRLSAFSLDSSNSTRVTVSICFRSSSGFLSRSKRYSPIIAPSAIAWAQASGSRPAIPAPCTIVATVEAPVPRRRRRAVPVTSRTVSRLKPSCLPRPTTRTRGVGSLPSVWMSVSSLFFPLISPSAMSWLMAPSNALSTAPVPPPGLVTPSNRLTITAFAGCWARSPFSTLIFTDYSLLFSASLS